MLLVEYTLLDNLQIINESTGSGGSKLKLRGRFQKCDEQNNNGRIYPRKILESQVQKIQEKINDRSLVGALDHPANDAIHLSQASHLITGLSVDKSGDVIGECEILSTPNGQIVKNLINDGVKIGISSRGVGSVSEGREGKVVNEDFKLITFDLVSDPSTKGAYPELTESIRENSQRAQEIISKHKKDRVLVTMLESKINEAFDRYDERSPEARMKRQQKKAGEEASAKEDPNLEIKAATQPERRGRYLKAMEKGGLAGARRAATRMDRNTDLQSSKVARAKRKIAKGTTGVPPGPGDRKSSRSAMRKAELKRKYGHKLTNSVELFGDIIRERCWKGYKPVKGKKPYSKGSCKKEAYERFGDAILNYINEKSSAGMRANLSPAQQDAVDSRDIERSKEERRQASDRHRSATATRPDGSLVRRKGSRFDISGNLPKRNQVVGEGYQVSPAAKARMIASQKKIAAEKEKYGAGPWKGTPGLQPGEQATSLPKAAAQSKTSTTPAEQDARAQQDISKKRPRGPVPGGRRR